MAEWAQTSIYLTADERQFVKQIMEQTGLSRSAVFRRAIRSFYEQGEFGDVRSQRLLEIAEELRRLA